MLTPQQFAKLFCYSDMNDINIQTLGYFIFRVYSNMVKLLNKELTRNGIDLQYPQFVIIMVLSRKEGFTQAELTYIVERDKASVSRNIVYLEEKGYVERKSPDGKKKQLFLTDKGKEIIPHLYQIATKNKETVLKGFTEDEKKDILEDLTKMYANLSSVLEK